MAKSACERYKLPVGLEASFAFAGSASPVELRILAINDFHGYLRPFSAGIGITDPAGTTKKIAVAAGGSETMAILVRQLREGHANAIFVAAGDLIGASPLLSAMFHDEPTIESLRRIRRLVHSRVLYGTISSRPRSEVFSDCATSIFGWRPA